MKYELLAEHYQLSSASSAIGEGYLDSKFLSDLRKVVSAINKIESRLSQRASALVILPNRQTPRDSVGLPTLYVNYGDGNVFIRDRIDFLRDLGGFKKFNWKHTPNRDDFISRSNLCGISLRQILEMLQAIGRLVRDDYDVKKTYRWEISSEYEQITVTQDKEIGTTDLSFYLETTNEKAIAYSIQDMKYLWGEKPVYTGFDYIDALYTWDCDDEPYTSGGGNGYWDIGRLISCKISDPLFIDEATDKFNAAMNEKYSVFALTNEGHGSIWKVSDTGTSSGVDDFEEQYRGKWEIRGIDYEEHDDTGSYWTWKKDLKYFVDMRDTRVWLGENDRTCKVEQDPPCTCRQINWICGNPAPPYDWINKSEIICADDLPPQEIRNGDFVGIRAPYKKVIPSPNNGQWVDYRQSLEALRLNTLLLTSDKLPSNLTELAGGTPITSLDDALEYVWVVPDGFYRIMKETLDNQDLDETIIGFKNYRPDRVREGMRLSKPDMGYKDIIWCYCATDKILEDIPEWVSSPDKYEYTPPEEEGLYNRIILNDEDGYPYLSEYYVIEYMLRNLGVDVGKYFHTESHANYDPQTGGGWLAWDECILPDEWFKSLEVRE